VADVPELEADAAADAMEAGALLLDVREPYEWSAGHVPDSLHVPMGDVAARAVELPRDREIIVVCRSGNRSAMVAEALLGAGYHAANLAGGLVAWAAEGLPLVADDGLPGAVA
jgi:rhodanese-related sulfurtransferase